MNLQQHFTNDGGREIDWGRTSESYAQHRPNYPEVFFDMLAKRGVGTSGQRLLDLGTGVGFLAQRFAENGADVTGIDIATGQLEVARQRAVKAGSRIEYVEAPAEETGLSDDTFDVVTASQCWLYFDKPRATAEVARVLKPGGLLAICHLCWLAIKSQIAHDTEQMVLGYNPQWSGAGYTGEVPEEMPEYLEGTFEQVELLVFDTEIPFSHESWRGRWRACRGVGASLSEAEISAFDRELQDYLQQNVPAEFAVPHRIDCRILRLVS